MIDIEREHLLTPAEAARRLPRSRRGRAVHKSTIFRWISRGLRGEIRLEAVKVGGQTFTSVEALQRFADRLTLASFEPEAGPLPSFSSDAEEAAGELEHMGF